MLLQRRALGAVLADGAAGWVRGDLPASIIDLPLPLNVTLHVQPIAQSEALALVEAPDGSMEPR